MAGLLDGFGAALVLLIVGFVAARRRLLVHEALDREVERHYHLFKGRRRKNKDGAKSQYRPYPNDHLSMWPHEASYNRQQSSHLAMCRSAKARKKEMFSICLNAIDDAFTFLTDPGSSAFANLIIDIN
eukprot:PDM68715.1 hypothetical protein PRIPAC_47017 [Pristionchus pacificus]